MSLERAEKLEKAIKKICRRKTLHRINKTLIPHIPDEILQQADPKSLEEKWHLLPYEKQSCLRIYLPCYDHYNQQWQIEHIDGSPPIKKDCTYCNFIIKNSDLLK